MGILPHNEVMSSLFIMVLVNNVIIIPMQGCIQDFFMGGGHTLVRPLEGLVACSPRIFFIFYVGL